jgi:hypothetical protein
MIINRSALSCVDFRMTVKKTVNPIVTKITSIGVSQMQEMDRHFSKVAQGTNEPFTQLVQR